jgi:hypothetical protein
MADTNSHPGEPDGFPSWITAQRQGAISEGHWTPPDGTMASERSKTDGSAGTSHHNGGELISPNTEATSSQPPRTHSTVRFGDAYIDAWKKRHSPKMHSPPAKSHGKWEGVWFARGTLRRTENEEKRRAEDLWKLVWRKLRTKSIDSPEVEDGRSSKQVDRSF